MLIYQARGVSLTLLMPAFIKKCVARLCRFAGYALLLCCLILDLCPAQAFQDDAAFAETAKIFAAVPGANNSEAENSREAIRSLSYPEQRALRAFCRLPDITAATAKTLIKELQNTQLNFETVMLLDHFSGLPGATVINCRELLILLNEVSFVTFSALRSLDRFTTVDAPALLPLIARVKELNEPGKWAAKALFEAKAIPFQTVTAAVAMLAGMSARQQWTAEQFCRLDNINSTLLLRGFGAMENLSSTNASNSRGLMIATPGITAETGLAWLENFFSHDTDEQEKIYRQFSTEQKKKLLRGYTKASEELLWEINDLHAVTDPLGREIGIDRLSGYADAEILALFSSLPLKAQKDWSEKIQDALTRGQRFTAIDILCRATEQARRDVAGELSTANIYLLLAHGDALYTSSARNILVPLLRQRLDKYFSGEILMLIEGVDPDNSYSSKFINNLAQKGALPQFLPENVTKQQAVLNLVAESASENEGSLLMFAAAFPKLLQPLHPEARSHLLQLMLNAIDDDTTIFSKQLRIIIQFYLQEHSDLLSFGDKDRLREMVKKKGAVDLKLYRQTPFHEWIEDNNLNSLSVFQKDDDGRASFLTNCRLLLENGYRPTISSDILPVPLPDDTIIELETLLKNSRLTPGFIVTELFRLSTKRPIVINWVKMINNIRITHSVTVYRDKEHQQRLLTWFLDSGYEMFAQRGHSYWRHHQLFEPLRAIFAADRLSGAKLQTMHRFLSLGSCGGITAYLELGEIFHDQIDILATLGIGKSSINNEYNRRLFEIVAADPGIQSWEEIDKKMTMIFRNQKDEDYIQPGSLPAILLKSLYSSGRQHGADQTD